MSYLPCENPNCKSFGKPHPNCRCHGEMAEGGEAGFCQSARAHDKGCEYYAEGGEATPDFIPDEEWDKGKQSPDFIPDEEWDKSAPDAAKSPDFIPDEEWDKSAPQADDTEEKAAAGDFSLPTSASDAASRVVGGGLFREPKEEPESGQKLTDEDIKSRASAEEENAGIASLVTGGGAVGAARKAAGAVAKAAELGFKGTAALKTAVELGLIHASDEASKALMGNGRPEDAVNPYLATGAVTLFGALAGGLGAKAAETGVKYIEGPLLEKAARAEKFLSGIGLASEGKELPAGADKALQAGHRFFKETVAGRLAEHAGRAVGEISPIPFGGSVGQGLGRMLLKPLIGKATGKISEYTMPTVVRWLQNGARGSVFNMIDYADKVEKGTSLINNSIDALFKGSAIKSPKSLEGEINKLRDYHDEGGMDSSVQAENTSQHDTQAFATGGSVKHEPRGQGIHADHADIADNMPEQNLLIQVAKGRISKHLSSQRPQKHQPKLAFDDEPDDRQQKKRYDNALQVAAHPIGVLGHIQKGTIEPEHIEHLNAMYPELTQHLQQKLTERIIKDQMDGKKPSYVVRQGLSMLMGAPLSGELTPANIQAAQSVFAPSRERPEPGKGQPNSRPGAPSQASTSHLSKSDQSYLTDDQARSARQQRKA